MIALLTFFGSMALAQLAPIPVTWDKIEGQPVRLRTGDDRVGIIKAMYAPPVSVKVPMEISGNLCSLDQDVSCELEVGAIATFVLAFWEKHPDPAKVGQPITQFGFPLSQFLFHAPDELKFYREPWMIPARLKCNKIPENLRQPDGSLYMLSWNSETMFGNPETGLTENQVVAGAFDLQWKSTGSDEWVLANAPAYFYYRDNFLKGAPLVGQVVTQTWKSSTGHCQTSFSANLSQLAEVIQNYILSIEETTPVPLLYKEDHLLNASEFESLADGSLLE